MLQDKKYSKGIFLGQYSTLENSGKKFFWEKLTDLFYFQNFHPLVFSPDVLASWEDSNPINWKGIITGKKTVISGKPFGPHKFKSVRDLLRYFEKIRYVGRYYVLANNPVNKEFLLNAAIYQTHIISIDHKWPSIPPQYGFLGYNTSTLGTYLYYYIKGTSYNGE
jgi:hypothetical protein